MKRLTVIVLFLLSNMIYSQDYELKDLPNSGTIDPSDIFMFSTSGGDLYKFTYTNLLGNLDDEAFVWTGNHDFNATTSITGGTFYIQNVKTASTAGELANTASYTYLKYKGAQEDTLATWRHTWQDNNTVYGIWEFESNVTFASQTLIETELAFSTDAEMLTPFITSTPISAGALGSILDGAHFLPVYGRTSLLTDTLMLYSDFYLDNQTIYGGWTFEGNQAFNGTLRTNNIAYLDSIVKIDDILTLVPNEISMSSGGAGYSTATSFLILDGHSDGTSEVSPITATGIADGTILVVMCDETDTHGFKLLSDAQTHLYGDLDLTMAAGDIVLLMYRDSDFYQAAPVLRQLTGSTPQVTTLEQGAQDLAITELFMVLYGLSGEPASEIDDFTGLKNDGTRITILDDPADPNGFTINDGTDIVCHGGGNITMTAGDVVEFIYYDGKWYQIAPYANNN